MPAKNIVIWSVWRKWLGNLLPMLVSLPMLAIGLATFRVEDPFSGPAIWLILGFPFVGWIVLNVLAPMGNGAMRDQLVRQMERQYGSKKRDLWFVGTASSRFKSMLDPHEDIALLWWEADTLHVFGEKAAREIPLKKIQKVGRLRSIHSWVGLGGWVTLEYEVEGANETLLMEPRQASTLLGNSKLRKSLADFLTHDEKKSAPGEPQDAFQGGEL